MKIRLTKTTMEIDLGPIDPTENTAPLVELVAGLKAGCFPIDTKAYKSDPTTSKESPTENEPQDEGPPLEHNHQAAESLRDDLNKALVIANKPSEQVTKESETSRFTRKEIQEQVKKAGDDVRSTGIKFMVVEGLKWLFGIS